MSGWTLPAVRGCPPPPPPPPLYSTPPLTASSVKAKFGPSIMGKSHADTLCDVRDPAYDANGFFTDGDLGFAQLTSGINGPENEALFERIIDKVHNHPDCRRRTGSRESGAGGMRDAVPFDLVRQVAIAEGASDIAHMMKQGFNFLNGSSWQSTGSGFVYLTSLCHHMQAHLDSVGASKHGADNFARNNRLQGLYRMIMRSQGVGNVSYLVMETAPGSGKFVAWRLSGVTIVFAPNPVWDSRLHAHTGGQQESRSFTGLIHFDMGCPWAFLRAFQWAFQQKCSTTVKCDLTLRKAAVATRLNEVFWYFSIKKQTSARDWKPVEQLSHLGAEHSALILCAKQFSAHIVLFPVCAIWQGPRGYLIDLHAGLMPLSVLWNVSSREGKRDGKWWVSVQFRVRPAKKWVPASKKKLAACSASALSDIEFCASFYDQLTNSDMQVLLSWHPGQVLDNKLSDNVMRVCACL